MNSRDKSVLDNVIYLDIVTTGFDELSLDIIEINAIKIIDNNIYTYKRKVQHEKKTLTKIQREKEYSEKIEEKVETLEQITKSLSEFLEDYPLICFNGIHLCKVMLRCFPEIKNNVLNIMELAAILEPWLKEYTLEYLVQKLTNISENKHLKNEFSNIECSIKVVNALLCREWAREERVFKRRKVTFYEILVKEYALEKRWAWTKYIKRPLLFTFQGYEYINYDENKIAKPKLKKMQIKYDEYENLLRKTDIWTNGGDFGYKYREQQRVLAEKIKTNIENEEKIFIEAPTGSGKTFAYLLILTLKAYINKGSYKVQDSSFIISTDTKELQNQLISKDIPKILMKLDLDEKIKYGSIKGKSNYICSERLEKSQNFNGELKSILAEVFLKRLCKDGKYGDIENISYFAYTYFSLEKYLSDVVCENESCNIEKCLKPCFLKNRYNELPAENITVINHSLLASWPYNEKKKITHLVIDEAHNLMEKCYDFFSEEFNSEEFVELLKNAYEVEPTIYRQLTNLNASNGYRENVELAKIKYWITEIKTNIGIMLNKSIELKLVKDEYNFRSEFSLPEEAFKEKINVLRFHISKIKENIYGIYSLLNRYLNNITSEEESKEDKDYKIVYDYIMKLKSSYEILDVFLENSTKKETHAKVIEVSKEYSYFKITNIPLNIEELVNDRILKDVKSTTFLSATFRINNSLRKMKCFLGQNEAKELILPQTFRLKDKTKIFVLNDIGRYNSSNFLKNSAKFIFEMALKLNGHMLILFTNNLRRKAVEEELAELARNTKFEIYSHKKSLKYLKDDSRQVIILGSKGFFEGIDIPGDALTCVMVDKIPNKSLEDPLLKAVTTYKKESYIDVNYPQVCIKLKQIYGRLVRSEMDYGYFCILDGGQNTNVLNKLEKDLCGPRFVFEDSKNILNKINDDSRRWKIENLKAMMSDIKNDDGFAENFNCESKKMNSFWIYRGKYNGKILFKNIDLIAEFTKK
ncbi:ATP-dependent DNA helicase [Clostridium sp. HBUAS56017]|uniref:ATP-dependent DNA helicase n=1 Tax=Clostridium sp. HBUAS56017 TaxID=2571128 RepID=UPI00163DB67B|nr:ATP-dependent DNA helicase [Clostridium sp. HBUAS56017]